LESKDIGFRKAEFVAKTQFLWKYFKLGGIGGGGWGGWSAVIYNFKCVDN